VTAVSTVNCGSQLFPVHLVLTVYIPVVLGRCYMSLGRLLMSLNIFLCQMAFGQAGQATPLVNLGMLEGTKVSASSVNGDRKVDDQYYGALNLFDGGENQINNINYTSWLTDNEPRHWVKLQFEAPVEVYSIMLELPGKASGTPVKPVLNTTLPTGAAQCITSLTPTPRPTEFAVDLTTQRSGMTITRKMPSVEITGFRLYYPLEKPSQNITSVTVVFPGPSILEVSELEVMGVPSKPGPLRANKADGRK
jgi:hypothetical protein